MTTKTRYALWWLLVTVLLVALIVASVLATREVVSANQPVPADSASARQTVAEAAKASGVKLLTYSHDKVEQQLTDALAATAGEFHDEYRELIHDVVIPGAQQQSISAAATVPAVGVQSLTDSTATLLLFINQKVTIGTAAPTDTASSVRMEMKNVDGRWLVTAFAPA